MDNRYCHSTVMAVHNQDPDPPPPFPHMTLERFEKMRRMRGEMRGNARQRDSDHITRQTHTPFSPRLTGPALGRPCDDKSVDAPGFHHSTASQGPSFAR